MPFSELKHVLGEQARINNNLKAYKLKYPTPLPTSLPPKPLPQNT